MKNPQNSIYINKNKQKKTKQTLLQICKIWPHLIAPFLNTFPNVKN